MHEYTPQKGRKRQGSSEITLQLIQSSWPFIVYLLNQHVRSYAAKQLPTRSILVEANSMPQVEVGSSFAPRDNSLCWLVDLGNPIWLRLWHSITLGKPEGGHSNYLTKPQVFTVWVPVANTRFSLTVQNYILKQLHWIKNINLYLTFLLFHVFYWLNKSIRTCWLCLIEKLW